MNATFAAHVALVVKQDRVSISVARMTAWAEGPDGYRARVTR